MSPDRRLPLAPRVIGELVIVVVGVLIALGVGNWNAGRKEIDQESRYLSGILLDLRSDSAALAYRMSTAVRGLEVADRLIELRRDPQSTAAPDSLAVWFFRVAFIDNFQILDHTYREILGAGGLGLIRDEELRRQVADYYRSMESAEFFTEYYKGEEADFWDILAARLQADDFEAISRSELGPGRLNAPRLLARYHQGSCARCGQNRAGRKYCTERRCLCTACRPARSQCTSSHGVFLTANRY